MFHFLNAIEERLDERKELAKRRLSAKTLLEQLDQIPRRINDPNLRTARTAHDVLAAKLHSCGAKPRGFGVDVRHFQQNPIPTARNGLRSVSQELATGAFCAA